jgi:hypothetical protein
MPQLPVLKRRRSRTQRALDRAKGLGPEALDKAKSAKVAGRPALKVAAVPVAVAGGAVVWRKAHKGSNGDAADADRPLGPVASADSVSPPAATAAEATNNEDGTS